MVLYPHFMEPEISLPFSQESASGPYLEPDASSPHPHSIFHSGIILPSTPKVF